MEDEIVLVDIYDKEIGTERKMKVHKEGKLHRAFSVFIIAGNKMLLQKRAYTKYHSGGLWTNACCSHPRKGENLSVAVQRRLQEELGIECSTVEIFSFIYFSQYKEVSEYEYDHVFLGKYSGQITINKDEIAEYKWIEISELEKWMLKNPKEFATWFLISCPKVLDMIKKES